MGQHVLAQGVCVCVGGVSACVSVPCCSIYTAGQDVASGVSGLAEMLMLRVWFLCRRGGCISEASSAGWPTCCSHCLTAWWSRRWCPALCR